MLFPIAYIKLLDIAIIVVILLSLWSGYRHGFLLKVLDCFGLVVSGFLSWGLARAFSFIHIYPVSMTPFADTPAFDVVYEVLNESMLFVVCFLLLNFIVLCLHPIFQFVKHVPILNTVNRVLGIVFGGVQGVLLLIVTVCVFQTPLFANGDRIIANSYLNPFYEIAQKVIFFKRETLHDLSNLQKIMTPSTILTSEEKEQIHDWFEAQGIGESDIEVVLDEK